MFIGYIDDFNRQGLGIEIDLSMSTEQVIQTLDQIIEWRGQPCSIRCDNEPEYISRKLGSSTDKHNIKLDFIQPSNPQQNAYIERYNPTIRLRALPQLKIMQLNSSGTTITNDLIWGLATLPPKKLTIVALCLLLISATNSGISICCCSINVIYGINRLTYGTMRPWVVIFVAIF